MRWGGEGRGGSIHAATRENFKVHELEFYCILMICQDPHGHLILSLSGGDHVWLTGHQKQVLIN